MGRVHGLLVFAGVAVTLDELRLLDRADEAHENVRIRVDRFQRRRLEKAADHLLGAQAR